MDNAKRHRVCWRVINALLRLPLRWIFRLKHENALPAGPCLIVSNHVTDYDPLFLAMSFPHTDLYFVASEHLFRKGLFSRLLLWTMAPIPRRKGSQGTDTVKACLRHLKAGHSVCIFAEGDASWDGRSSRVFPATGKMARVSGADLMTYRIEGGYLTKPRWSATLRRGRIYGHPVALYSAEQLKQMKPEQITDVIDRDIYENAWTRQREEAVRFRGKRLAENLELALFCCPRCGKIGTLHTKNDRLFCDCGLDVRYGEDGMFSPREPFATIADWEDWQQEHLKSLEPEPGTCLFSDPGVSLSHVSSEHRDELLCEGELIQLPDRLRLGEREFMLEEIASMAMVQKQLLLFSCEEEYYELKVPYGVNLRKYLSWWNTIMNKQG